MNRLDYMVQVGDLRASLELRARIAALAGEVKRPRRRFRPWMGVCAALAVVVLGGAWLVTNVRMGGSAGGGGHDDASTFMSYAGPIFSLTLGEENDSITAERNITLDFAPWEPEWVSNEEEVVAMEGLTETERQEALEQHNGWFTDGGYYRGYDHSDTDQTLTVYYPFAAILEELSKYRPTLSLDGTELDTALVVGGTFDRETGTMMQDFSIPEPEESSYGSTRCLVVLGRT